MRKILNPDGGRPLENEDMLPYIDNLEMQENIFKELNFGDTIVSGCIVTGTTLNANISEGIVFLENKLATFEAVTGVSLPYNVTLSVTDTDAREFNDGIVRNTIREQKAVAGGIFGIDADTPRVNNRFLRNVNGELLGNINTDLEGLGDLYKPNLFEKSQNWRVLPTYSTDNAFIKIGEFLTAQFCNFTVFFNGFTHEAQPCSFLVNFGKSGSGLELNVKTIGIPTENMPKFVLVDNQESPAKASLYIQKGTGASYGGTFLLLGENFTTNGFNIEVSDWTDTLIFPILKTSLPFEWTAVPSGAYETDNVNVSNTSVFYRYEKDFIEIKGIFQFISQTIGNKALFDIDFTNYLPLLTNMEIPVFMYGNNEILQGVAGTSNINGIGIVLLNTALTAGFDYDFYAKIPIE